MPEERYHFPAAYLRQVEAAVGDFILYYEPGRTGLDERNRTGRRAYVATAKVTDVSAPTRRGLGISTRVIDPTTYVGFDRPVPFREGAHYYEGQLRRDDGARARARLVARCVRSANIEYDAILRAGFARELEASNTVALPASPQQAIRPELLEITSRVRPADHRARAESPASRRGFRACSPRPLMVRLAP